MFRPIVFTVLCLLGVEHPLGLDDVHGVLECHAPHVEVDEGGHAPELGHAQPRLRVLGTVLQANGQNVTLLETCWRSMKKAKKHIQWCWEIIYGILWSFHAE